jgi:hypothetical protein
VRSSTSRRIADCRGRADRQCAAIPSLRAGRVRSSRATIGSGSCAGPITGLGTTSTRQWRIPVTPRPERDPEAALFSKVHNCLNPDVGLSAPDTLHPEGLYAFRFDLNGDAREEVTFKFRSGDTLLHGSAAERSQPRAHLVAWIGLWRARSGRYRRAARFLTLGQSSCHSKRTKIAVSTSRSSGTE